jgi:cellulose biosynthesis protein BcsQ
MKSVALFNNKGGVGKTSLVFHLSWMLSDLGVSVLAVDLDPQSNLTSMFLTDARLQDMWANNQTIYAAIQPLMDRSGDVSPAAVERVTPQLHLVPGDLRLSRFEDLLAENWSRCLTGEVGAFRVMSSLYRVIQGAAREVGAQAVLIDLGPNLGALNRAAMLAADFVVLPVAPDLFSLQGMENLGPVLRDWSTGWQKRKAELTDSDLAVPEGLMKPAGYVAMNFGARDSSPVQAYDYWMTRIPEVYRRAVLGAADLTSVPNVGADPHCLASLKHYRSLMPMAMAARKPIFHLKTADGARGAHLDAVRACGTDFELLVRSVCDRIGLPLPAQG